MRSGSAWNEEIPNSGVKIRNLGVGYCFMSEVENLPNEVLIALTELEEHYQNFETMPRGANGYLYFAKNRVSDMDVAIKFYAGEPGENRHNEPRQLSAITCPNVLPILEARSISEEWAFFVTPRCFEGDLDEAQLKRLTDISERCPVHRTLTSETKIRTTMRKA